MGNQGSGFTRLLRGGLLVKTARGNLQLGCPPETIKDTMRMEGGVPHTYIIPRQTFDFEAGIATADVEFPIYYHFFIKKSRTRIVCTHEQRDRIVRVLSEALFGPASFDVSGEFALGSASPDFPDLRKELDFFRRVPGARNGLLELDDLVDLVEFDANGVAAFAGFAVRREPDGLLSILDGEQVVASIPADVPIIETPAVEPDYSLDFKPPVFGITILGSSHGFNPDGRTSGMVFWVNRRGIAVDPPVGTVGDLLRLGVSPKLIDKVVLTHCHADHDAGTLQKILQEGKINLYTTPTIYRSFLRKSAALTGLTETQLERLVRFYPITIGKPMLIDQARFQFHYTLHSIPTIGIQAFLGDKSLIYSSDTMAEPQFIGKLHEQGIVSAGRRDSLVNLPWDRDVVVHEAGIPPLHTPMSYLCTLPADVRQRTFLVHIDPKTIPADSGLRVAPTGLDNTIVLTTEPRPHEEAISVVDGLNRIDIFDNLPFSRMRQLLLYARVRALHAGETLFKQGDPGDAFLVVLSGAVDIVVGDRVLTTYSVGGFFGEKSLFMEETRTASAVARSEARVLSIPKDEMMDLIRGTEAEQLLRQIALLQNADMRDTLMCNPVARGLTASQRTLLHGILKSVDTPFAAGEAIALDRGTAHQVYVVKEGTVEALEGGRRVAVIARGGFLGLTAFFHPDEAKGLTFKALDPVQLYSVSRADLREYVHRNPGFHMRLFADCVV